MTEQQVLKLLGVIVEHGGGFKTLSDSDSQWLGMNTKDAIALCVKAIKNRNSVVPNSEKILRLRKDEILIPAITRTIVLAEDFIVDTSDKAEVNIS